MKDGRGCYIYPIFSCRQNRHVYRHDESLIKICVYMTKENIFRSNAIGGYEGRKKMYFYFNSYQQNWNFDRYNDIFSIIYVDMMKKKNFLVKCKEVAKEEKELYSSRLSLLGKSAFLLQWRTFNYNPRVYDKEKNFLV